MDRIEVSTVVYVSAEEAFEFLVDFPRYAQYSKYLDSVQQHGTGGAGTKYDLTFRWWKLTYTARSEVTSIEENKRIDWELVNSLDATGYWGIEPLPEETETSDNNAVKVRFVAEFDSNSMTWDLVNVPRFVSTDWIVRKVKPLIVKEAKRIVGRVVADLEGESREVTLTVHETPDTI
ncbi:SRPBCC family protein [Salinarchaeum sp. IM2453]|uniref:type II toxin-antitoxin system RatA family toxin n=1 Tax=Salinarchaeum sp. IM2453 TaxID=2862870 RepID=UPI001C83AE28|nr:SRPBCC family protein [Salinarchaeum sp. IM2453]QZA88696.1 SRPBCC family protein [Salinarchaeum sp. IM2453]